VRGIKYEGGTVTSTAFTCHKIILNYLDKPFVKMQFFFCLFPQDVKNLSHIHQDHVAGDMPLKEFKIFCH